MRQRNGLVALLISALLLGCAAEENGGAPEEDTRRDAVPAEQSTTSDSHADADLAMAADEATSLQPAATDAPRDAPLAITAADEPGFAPENLRAPASLSAPERMRAPAAMAVPQTSATRTMPAGSTREAGQAFATVQVFYATDRQRGPLALGDYDVRGQQQLFFGLVAVTVLAMLLAFVLWLMKKTGAAAAITLMSAGCAAAAVACVAMGQTQIEKHGVTYNGERGQLVRGICEVTVPDSHDRGELERPSILRLEFHENQDDHIVLTSATELSASDFRRRLQQTVAGSPNQDMLLFIHGYNVDFESAVHRTAQIAVDLPFEGVPVCYSWPSQAKLLGYTVDANNADWTAKHLKQFLLELAEQSGARSINVVAHSMGNRAMTAAMQQLQLGRPETDPPLFDRVVLAAPDVDADRFRREFAPALRQLAQQITLYASSDDRALQASRAVHGHPRAGDSRPTLVIAPGIETIDVSGIDLSLLGHSYYGDTEPVLRDLEHFVGDGLTANQRGWLIPRGQNPEIYWQLAELPGVPTR